MPETISDKTTDALVKNDVNQESIKTVFHLLGYIRANTNEISPAMIQATAELIKTID